MIFCPSSRLAACWSKSFFSICILIMPEYTHQDPITKDLIGNQVPQQRSERDSYYRTLCLACDVDLSLIDASHDTPKTVKKKVTVFNQFVLDLAEEEGLDIDVVLLTQKPSAAFFNKETQPLYGPLLKLNSTVKQQPIPSTLVLCEFGAVSLTKNDGKWTDNLNFDAFGEDYPVLEKFKTWLHQNKYISETGEADPAFPYRLEPGNKSYLALQLPKGQSMSEATKEKLKKEIPEKLKAGQRLSILNFFSFETEKADFDCIPKRLQKLTKEIGVDQIIKYMHARGRRWFGREHLCVVDDKVHAAGVAAKNVLLRGGLAVAPANADGELKKILNEVGLGGRVSQYKVFLGAIEGIYRAVTGKELSKEKLTNLAQQLL